MEEGNGWELGRGMVGAGSAERALERRRLPSAGRFLQPAGKGLGNPELLSTFPGGEEKERQGSGGVPQFFLSSRVGRGEQVTGVYPAAELDKELQW